VPRPSGWDARLGADQESERLVGILREHPAARPLMGLSGGTDPAAALETMPPSSASA
jgi:hypothetical protein